MKLLVYLLKRSSGLRDVQKCANAQRPPTSGGPPFDLSRADKFDYEKP